MYYCQSDIYSFCFWTLFFFSFFFLLFFFLKISRCVWRHCGWNEFSWWSCRAGQSFFACVLWCLLHDFSLTSLLLLLLLLFALTFYLSLSLLSLLSLTLSPLSSSSVVDFATVVVVHLLKQVCCDVACGSMHLPFFALSVLRVQQVLHFPNIVFLEIESTAIQLCLLQRILLRELFLKNIVLFLALFITLKHLYLNLT